MWADRSNSTAEGGARRKVIDTQNSQQKYFVASLKAEADDFKRQYKYVDKEKLFMELQHFKMENNQLREDNLRHKTRILQTEKELQRYEKICEEMQAMIAGQKNGKPLSHELLLIQLKKQNKDLSKQLQDRLREAEHLKKNSKVTRAQELECDRKAYYEETVRLRKILEESGQQMEQMQQKFNQYLQLEADLTKQIKNNDQLMQENKLQQVKIGQGEDLIKHLQQLYKINQQKQQALEKQVNDLRGQVKKLQTEKANLKTTLKEIQDQQYQQLSQQSTQKSPPQNQKKPKPHSLNSLIVDELRLKLISRGIEYSAFVEMLEGLKESARQKSVVVQIEDIRYILSQEPFQYSDQQKINQILNALSGEGERLVDNFNKLVGQYKSFQNFQTFDFRIAQAKQKQMLMQSKRKIEDFWAKHKGKGKFVTKNDVRKMLNHLGVDWDEPSYLFYYLSLFEKSKENLFQIDQRDTWDPFLEEVDSQENQLPSQQSRAQQKKHGQERISEESDEELFDKQSQDYSLDENAIRANNVKENSNQNSVNQNTKSHNQAKRQSKENSVANRDNIEQPDNQIYQDEEEQDENYENDYNNEDDQQPIVFRDEGQIVAVNDQNNQDEQDEQEEYQESQKGNQSEVRAPGSAREGNQTEPRNEEDDQYNGNEFEDQNQQDEGHQSEDEKQYDQEVFD